MSQPKGSEPSDLEAQRAVEEQLSFVLADPGISAWLKNALRSALERDPIEVLNDLEILNLVLKNRSHTLIAENYSKRLRRHDL